MDKVYNPAAVEKHWQQYWRENDVYVFDPGAPGELYSIDTPPPTVSGSLHMGHVFSYTQAEIIARYRRMQGYNVFYPFGFDDNGLPTERLVEKETGMRGRAMPRDEFNALCMKTVKKYHHRYRELWQALGLSVDWNLCYSTITPRVCRISQRSFLELYRKGRVNRRKSPALWCPECGTAIAQAELEEREKETTFNWLVFKVDGHELPVATTRPELLAACVALVIHPGDSRFAKLEGKRAEVPLYGRQVPVIADTAVDPAKGSGAVMVCTFGDQQDVIWWQKYNLPLLQVITADGRISRDIKIAGGMEIPAARDAVLQQLARRKLLRNRQPLTHRVSVHERCGRPVEYLAVPQWFIKIMDRKPQLLEAGERIRWYPLQMGQRYRDWVNNLQWDWCISRQRFFGVPFPVWYCRDCGAVLTAPEEELPVNPLSRKPGFNCRCGSGSFDPDSDVMDTWATSSLTPLINARWGEEGDFTGSMLPMSMRTQAHEIIRTWAFYTIAMTLFHRGEIPWRHIMICGFVTAKPGEKISKSKGNTAETPGELIEKYSADAVRYWAAGSRLGSDIAFTPWDLLAGRRLAVKLWNAGRFSLSHLKDYRWRDGDVTEPLDGWMLARLGAVQSEVRRCLDQYQVGTARECLERFFWHDFCDNWLEVVKDRLYNPDRRGRQEKRSAQGALWLILTELLKIYGPYLPHITEEIFMRGLNHNGEVSLHRLCWSDLSGYFSDFPGEVLWQILGEVRKFKTSGGLSLAEPLSALTVTVPEALMGKLAGAEDDLKAASKAAQISFKAGDSIISEVSL